MKRSLGHRMPYGVRGPRPSLVGYQAGLHAFAILFFACIPASFLPIYWLPLSAILPALAVTAWLEFEFSFWRFALVGLFPLFAMSRQRPGIWEFPSLLLKELEPGNAWQAILCFELYLGAYVLFTWIHRWKQTKLKQS
jgi:hypothetical protein